MKLFGKAPADRKRRRFFAGWAILLSCLLFASCGGSKSESVPTGALPDAVTGDREKETVSAREPEAENGASPDEAAEEAAQPAPETEEAPGEEPEEARTDPSKAPPDEDLAPADAVTADGESPENGGFRVVAYVTADSVSPTGFDDSHLGDVTDIILISAARFDKEGTIAPAQAFRYAVRTVKKLTEDLEVRIHVSISGPGSVVKSTDWNTQMASMAREHKKAFDSGVLETNIRAFLEEYGLDGVFFDYEFPTASGAKKQFGDFLVSLRRTLCDDFIIGMAVSSWCADYPENAIGAVDMVELMSYDLWDADGFHATFEIAKDNAETLLSLGYPAEKIDLGIPFYARPTTHEEYWYLYRDYCGRLDENGLYYDRGTGLTHSFNTPETVYDKTAWAIENGLGGVMVFHYTCDAPADNDLSLFGAIVRAKNDKA